MEISYAKKVSRNNDDPSILQFIYEKNDRKLSTVKPEFVLSN